MTRSLLRQITATRNDAPTLVTYRCPRCGHTVEAPPGSDVGHRCPHVRNRWVRWETDG